MWTSTKGLRSPKNRLVSKTTIRNQTGKYNKEHEINWSMKNNFVREKDLLDAYYSEEWLYQVLRALSLHCVRRSHTTEMKLKVAWSWAKFLLLMSLFTAVSIICLYYKIQLYLNTDMSRTILLSHILYIFGLVQYLVDLIYAYKYGRDDCINHFNNYDNIDIILGLTKYREIRRKISSVLIYVFLMCLSCYGIEYLLWMLNDKMYLASLYAVEYLFLLVKTATIMGMVGQCIQVEYRLRCIGDTLKKVAKHAGPARNSSVPNDHALCLDTLIYNSKNHLNVKWLNKCYLLLQQQCQYVNNLYGMRLLLSSTYYLVYLIITLNTVMKILTGQIILQSKFPALGQVLSITACGLVLFLLAHRCERCYRAGEWVVGIIDGILIHHQNDGNEGQESLELLRDLISSRPVNFHAVNFFRIDYDLLVSIASVVITYTIIMFQSVA